MTLYFLEMSESTSMDSYQEDLNNDDITEYVNMERGSLWGLNQYRQLGQADSGRNGLPQGGHLRSYAYR